MRRKRFLSLTAVVLTAMLLSACGAEADGNNADLENDNTSALESENIAVPTIEPPEDGWTNELINQVLYIDDTPLTLPCTIKDLSDEYRYDYDSWDPSENKPFGVIDIYNGNKKMFNTQVTSADNVKKINDKMFIDNVAVVAALDEFKYGELLVNGCGLDSTESEVISLLGNPDAFSETGRIYYYFYSGTEDTAVKIYLRPDQNDDTKESTVSMMFVYSEDFYK